MAIKKFRWSRVYESSEEELLDLLATKNIYAERSEVKLGGEAVTATAESDTSVWCAEGSLTIYADGPGLALQPGDGAHISAGTTYELNPGLTGYVSYTAD